MQIENLVYQAKIIKQKDKFSKQKAECLFSHAHMQI